MTSPDQQDWRLTGQEKYLKGATLAFRRYKAPRPGWDHDHCSFCWAKFSEAAEPGTLQEGYSTLDGQHWICPDCFSDFKERFGFKITDGSPSR